MRILHISTRLILGGSQENTVLSCEGQARMGHDVHLAFGPIYGPEGSLLDRVLAFRSPDGAPITTHTVHALVRPLHPFLDARCYVQLKRLIRRLKPDIVHTHSSKAGILGRAAAWAVDHRRCGIVHTVHGPPFHPYQRESLNRLYAAAERFAARRCHLIVSVADAMTEQYLSRGIGSPDQYVTVRSGMEIDPFVNPPPTPTRDETRSRLGIRPDDLVIGTVARLAELKGHDDLLDALADDLRAQPHWKLLWVGDGWWRDRLLARVRDLGLHGRVVTTGLVPPQRIPELMRAMDILAHPSYREGLPRTVPQALLSGVPPVAYDVDGTREACIDRTTGLLVPPGDIHALRDAIRTLADDPALRRRLADQGRRLCIQRFSADLMVQDLQSVYDRALRLAGRTDPPTPPRHRPDPPVR